METDVYDVQEVANFLIEHTDNNNLRLTNLRMQKLLYFIQSYALISLDRPAFTQDFQAWNYGPVVPELYRTYSHNGSGLIKSAQRIMKLDGSATYENGVFNFNFNTKDAREIGDELKSIVVEVCETFRGRSDFDLVHLSHELGTWKEHFHTGERNRIIPKHEIAELLKGASNE